MSRTVYSLEADTHSCELVVEYSEDEYKAAIKHFKRWLRDKKVFNKMFYKVIYDNDKIIDKQYIKIKK